MTFYEFIKFSDSIRKIETMALSGRARINLTPTRIHKQGQVDLRNLIAIISFFMAVFGSLAVMFIRDREKQKMASMVALVFLLAFFINLGGTNNLFLKIACLIAFAISILGGIVTIFSNVEFTRIGAMIVGVVALGVCLMILFVYIELPFFN